MKKQIQRVYQISLLNDQAQNQDRESFLHAMKKHSDDFFTVILFCLIFAITTFLALWGIV